MHTRDALAIGENAATFVLLDVWRETELYTEKKEPYSSYRTNFSRRRAYFRRIYQAAAAHLMRKN